jgi:hypothetical protein
VTKFRFFNVKTGGTHSYHFLYTFMWVQNLVTPIMGKTLVGGVWEWGAKEKT